VEEARRAAEPEKVSIILDASAVLAYLLDEPGGEKVFEHLRNASIPSLCYSEVLGRTFQLNGDFEAAKYRVDALKLTVVPFDANLAAVAASLLPATRPFGISLADRSCLATAMERRLPVLTSDRDWAKAKLPVKLVFFR